MKLVGLTGGIGSGKSTVSALLRERGAVIVDADLVTRELQEPGQPVFVRMVERFGPGIVRDDGTLHRQAVADIVFNDADALADLNAITRPAIEAEMYARGRRYNDTDDIVVFDIALLIEGGGYQVDGIVVVHTPLEVAVRRLVELRGMAEDDARARIAAQLAPEDRLAVADFVVDNGGDPGALRPQVDALLEWARTLPDKRL